MFSDPQFWVAISFVLFVVAIFNPVKKILISNLDNQIREIKNKIEETENIKNEAQKTLNELINREAEVTSEIQKLEESSEQKISTLKKISLDKLNEQIEKRKLVTESKIDQLVRDANLTIKNYILHATIEATTHILKNNLSSKNKAELIEDSISELNSVLKN